MAALCGNFEGRTASRDEAYAMLAMSYLISIMTQMTQISIRTQNRGGSGRENGWN